MRTLLIATLAIVALCTCAAAQEPAWEADFSKAGAAELYREDGGTQITTAEVDGATVLAATMPGDQQLEGVCVEMGPGFEGGRRYTARAEVRGSGTIWPMLISRNGWLYARATVTLSDDWQEIWLTKPLDLQDDRMRLCILTKEQNAVTMQVRSAVAVLEPAPVVWDRDVAAVRFAAAEARTRSTCTSRAFPRHAPAARSMCTFGREWWTPKRRSRSLLAPIREASASRRSSRKAPATGSGSRWVR